MESEKQHIINEQRLNGLCNEWETVLFLNSNDQGPDYLALANSSSKSCETGDLNQLQDWLNKHKDTWTLGYFGYDLKNELEKLSSCNDDVLNMPDSYFFVPDVLLKLTNKVEVLIGDFAGFKSLEGEGIIKSKGKLQWKESKQAYIKQILKIKDHIQLGDIYELNYCHEFYLKEAKINPSQLYIELNHLTHAPFSTFLKMGNKYVSCASPERFIRKKGNRVISQPIKGTIKRGENSKEDAVLVNKLRNDPKERSENIMIVDLVRNDLSKIAMNNTVSVDELCEIYSFRTVHQMISTVSAEANPSYSNTDILLACFPMGSMTGAPKVRAMKLIEKYEKTKRGVYSGTIGYFSPDGDFDFNVVIRALIYNADKAYLSGIVGGAITSKSDPNNEYDETKLKAQALIEAIEKCIK
ncbi:MAG: anthranilate synthase component I family protein [Crocinitomicaceae bacterium]|mgnify:FL=1|nr:anthranilate synthase component I family protein [Crocinitomicaceae bacterium]